MGADRLTAYRLCCAALCLWLSLLCPWASALHPSPSGVLVPPSHELAGPPPPPPPPPSMAPNAPPPNVQESAPRSGLGITLGWDENANTNDWGPFTYEVQAHVVGVPIPEPLQNVDQRKCTVPADILLKNKTSADVDFRVRAKNSLGQGPWSSPVRLSLEDALYVDTSAPPQSPANEAGRGKKLNPFDNVADVLRLPGAIVKIKVIGNLTGPKNELLAVDGGRSISISPAEDGDVLHWHCSLTSGVFEILDRSNPDTKDSKNPSDQKFINVTRTGLMDVLDGTLTVDRVRVWGCVTEYAFRADASSLVITNGVFYDNHVALQGKNPDVAMRVQNCEFYNNSKAAVACSGSPCKVTILNSTFWQHRLFVVQVTGLTGSFRIENSLFRDNVGAVLEFRGEGKPLVITDCVFRDNQLGNADLDGTSSPPLKYTALSVQGGSISVLRSTFTSHRSRHGLGLLKDTKGSISGCTFSDNVATYAGGVFEVSGGDITFLDSTFERNSASSAGGCFVLSSNGKASLQNCVVQHNVGGARGGVFSMATGFLTMTSSTFLNNSASKGGVVHAVTADVAINGGTFEKNWAEAAGGVLSLLEAKLSIEGGAVFQENWVNTKGGVLISLLGTISIAGPATFRENRASLGGVMYLAELDGTQPVQQSVFEDNKVDSRGGVIYVQDAALRIEDSQFKGNSAKELGGSIFSTFNSISQIEGSSFTNNVASSGSGGAIYCSECHTLMVSNSCTFEGNKAMQGTGGAVYSSEYTLFEVRDSTFHQNDALSGGGLHVGPGVEYKMQSLVVNGNHATDKGGGILFSISSTSSSSSSFSVDKANLLSTSTKTQEFVSQWEDFSPLSSSSFVSSVSFVANVASAGGALYWTDSQPVMNSVSFSNNQAAYGGDLASAVATLRLVNITSLEASSGQTMASFSVELLDQFNQRVSTDSISSITIQGSNTNLTTSGALNAVVQKGVASFSNVIVTAKPGNVIQLEMFLTSQTSIRASVPVNMTACPVGMYEDLGTNICRSCDDGQYTFSAGQTSCKDCPDGGTCSDGLLIGAEEGYWRTSTSSEIFYDCPEDDSCLGGANSDCTSTNMGPVCALCADGYVMRKSGDCLECPSVGITITYLVALCAGVIFFVYLFFKIRSKRAITRAKILISFMQMLNAMPEYEVDWPSNFLNFAKWFSWANLDLFSATSIECLTGSIGTFYTKLLVVCMLPVIAVLALLIMYFVTLHKAKSREQRMQRAGLYMNRVFLVLFIMYPGVSVPLLQFFSCRTFDDGNIYLHADYRLHCFDAQWMSYLPFVIFMLCCISVGFPLSISLILVYIARLKRKIQSADDQEVLSAGKVSTLPGLGAIVFATGEGESLGSHLKKMSSFDLMDGTPDTPGVVSQNLEVEDDAGSEVQEEGSTIGVDKRFSKMSIPGRIESLDSQELGPRDPVYERPVTFMSDSETLLKPPGCNRHSTPLSAPLHRRQQAVNFGESSSLHVQGLLAEDTCSPRSTMAGKSSRSMLEHSSLKDTQALSTTDMMVVQEDDTPRTAALKARLQKMVLLFRFLFVDYRDGVEWWEVEELLRKLLLASVLLVLDSENSMQISLAVLVSCLALLLHMSEKPFSNKFDQLVQGMSLGTLLATCFVGLLVKLNGLGDSTSEFGIALIVSAVAVNFCGVIVICTEIFHACREMLIYTEQKRLRKCFKPICCLPEPELDTDVVDEIMCRNFSKDPSPVEEADSGEASLPGEREKGDEMPGPSGAEARLESGGGSKFEGSQPAPRPEEDQEKVRSPATRWSRYSSSTSVSASRSPPPLPPLPASTSPRLLAVTGRHCVDPQPRQDVELPTTTPNSSMASSCSAEDDELGLRQLLGSNSVDSRPLP